MSKEEWHSALKLECAKRDLAHTVEQTLIGYVDKLIDKGLPVILDFEHLSRLLGIRQQKLAAMVYGTEKFHRHFRIV